MNFVSRKPLLKILKDIQQLEREGHTKDQAIEIIKIQVLTDMMESSNRISNKLEDMNQNIDGLTQFQQKDEM